MKNRLFELMSGTVPGRFHAPLFSMYPPFVGAGIRVLSISPDSRRLRVRLAARPWTSNLFGTQFGGSIYAMTDPFYGYLLQRNLGDEFICWDKSATVRFKKPGVGPLTAAFELSEEVLGRVREAVARERRHDEAFLVHVRDAKGDVVAEVEKVVAVRERATKRGSRPRPVT